MTGNSKTAPIDLFPGQLVGCTTTAPFKPKYQSTTIKQYHTQLNSKLPARASQQQSTTEAEYHKIAAPQYHCATVQKYLFSQSFGCLHSSKVPQFNATTVPRYKSTLFPVSWLVWVGALLLLNIHFSNAPPTRKSLL